MSYLFIPGENDEKLPVTMRQTIQSVCWRTSLQKEKPSDAARPAPFGVRIDWRGRAISVDSPKTRTTSHNNPHHASLTDHNSIPRSSRPHHIHRKCIDSSAASPRPSQVVSTRVGAQTAPVSRLFDSPSQPYLTRPFSRAASSSEAQTGSKRRRDADDDEGPDGVSESGMVIGSVSKRSRVGEVPTIPDTVQEEREASPPPSTPSRETTPEVAQVNEIKEFSEAHSVVKEAEQADDSQKASPLPEVDTVASPNVISAAPDSSEEPATEVKEHAEIDEEGQGSSEAQDAKVKAVVVEEKPSSPAASESNTINAVQPSPSSEAFLPTTAEVTKEHDHPEVNALLSKEERNLAVHRSALSAIEVN